MEKIEGIELDKLATRIERAIIDDLEEAIGKQLRGIIANINYWRQLLRENERESASLKEKIAKALAKFDDVRKGNWSVLPELKVEKPSTDKPQPQEAA